MNTDPATLRKVYFDAWQKVLKGEPQTPMEAMIAEIIQRHPEYHQLFGDPNHFENYQNEKFNLDHNPFFHLGLHVTIAEQVSVDRPFGIRELYHQLLKKYGDKNIAEHKMMECLAKLLIHSFHQADNQIEEHYLEAIRKLI